MTCISALYSPCSALLIRAYQYKYFFKGVAKRNWQIIYLGRLFLSSGENLYAAKPVVISQWFPDYQISFAFGTTVAISRCGGVLADLLSPRLANAVDFSFAIWTGFMAGIVMLTSSIVLYFTHASAHANESPSQILTEALLEDNERAIARNHVHDLDGCEGRTVTGSERFQSFSSESELQPSTTGISDLKRIGPLFWAIAMSAAFVYGSEVPFLGLASGILLERSYFQLPPSSCELQYPGECTAGFLSPPQGNPSFDEDGVGCPSKHVAPVLPSSLNVTKENTEWDESWMKDEYVFEALESKDVSCADKFWADACTVNYCDEEDEATEKTGAMMCIPLLIGILLSMPLGYIADTVGHMSRLAMFSPVFMVVSHFQLAFSSLSPAIPLILQGIAFALYAVVIWPCLALIVDIKYQGIAYGIVQCCLNTSFTIFPLIAAQIYNIDQSYIPNVEILFAFNGIIGIFAGCAMNYFDASLNDGKLGRGYFSS